jgi:hypothetical protein
MATLTKTWRIGGETAVMAVSKDDRQSVMVYHPPRRSPTHLDSQALGRGFEAALRKDVPPELVEDVLAWLERPSE